MISIVAPISNLTATVGYHQICLDDKVRRTALLSLSEFLRTTSAVRNILGVAYTNDSSAALTPPIFRPFPPEH